MAYSKSFIKGRAAEALFRRVMRDNNCTATRGNEKEDRDQHIDFYVGGFVVGNKSLVTVDVKGDKKADRTNGEILTKQIIVEYKGVEGRPGVIEGKQDLIAFKVGSKFVLVDRDKLKKECYSKVPPDSKTTQKSHEAIEKNMLYERPPNKKNGKHRGIMLFVDLDTIERETVIDEIDIPQNMLDWYNTICSKAESDIDVTSQVDKFENTYCLPEEAL